MFKKCFSIIFMRGWRGGRGFIILLRKSIMLLGRGRLRRVGGVRLKVCRLIRKRKGRNRYGLYSRIWLDIFRFEYYR